MKKIIIVFLFIILSHYHCAYQAEDTANTKQQTCNNNLAAMLFLSNQGSLSSLSDAILITGVVRYISCRNKAINAKDNYIIPL
ncbi:MAG: hypothetical protein H7A23_02380 [Leptospiraceae bacterium]|nr:hypothetical protein [Leptospiraceae bacterium]MCP5493378.1 hypothetical protein [Leptospiraceae bacterium]